MKWTPQKAITSRVRGGRLARQAERVAHEVGHVLDLGHLVVVGEDHGVALLGERAHLSGHPGGVRGAQSSGARRESELGGSIGFIAVFAL